MEYNVYLSKNQKEKLKTCFNNKKGCTLRIEPKVGNNKLILTADQIQKLKTARSHNKSCDIKLSITQLEQSGGFLPFLIPLLAAAAPFVGKALAGTAISAGAQKIFDKISGKGVQPKKKTRKRKLKGQGYILPWMK